MPSWSRKTEIRLLLRAISHPDTADIRDLVDALDATVQGRFWAEQRTRGKPIESFSEFVLAPPRAGLDVKSMKPLRFLRLLLIDAGYAEGIECLSGRLPGRSRKTSLMVKDTRP
jgi:hypothetical protein